MAIGLVMIATKLQSTVLGVICGTAVLERRTGITIIMEVEELLYVSAGRVMKTF
jgi:hypothetical protein